MYRPACCRRPLLLFYLGVAGLASAQELPPLNPASEGLTPERIAEIRRIFQVESETTSSDQSIRIVGDCISYPDKSTLLSFTEDVRAALERTLRAPSAKTTDDSRAVTFRGPQFRILIRGSLSEPDAISNGAPASVRSRLASNRTGTEIRPGLTLLLTNPGPQLDPHELSEHIVDGLIRENDGEKVPVILFTKGGGLWLKEMAATGADCIGLDWTVNLTKARACVQDAVALQGNLDPAVLFADEASIRREARRVIDSFGKVGNGGHVFNLGHGINQHTDPEAVRILVDEVHNYSRQMHAS